MLPSKSQINRCGKLLKRVAFDGTPASATDVMASYRILEQYRQAHAYPMLKVRMGLRSMCRTEQAQDAVTQRLKRVPRILRKLHRMPAMPLYSLEDIGGVRAVLTDGPELERVYARIERRWGHSITRVRNYINTPKPMGYRAVHAIVERDGRKIEIQLRTRGQQQWAQAIENADARLGLNLKDEDGPPEMRRYFAAAAEMIYLNEYGREVPAALLMRFSQARHAVIEAGFYTE